MAIEKKTKQTLSKKTENSLLGEIQQLASNVISGLLDVFTGRSYEKTKSLRIEQFKQNDAIHKLALEVEKINEDLNEKREDILQLLNAIKELDKVNSETIKSFNLIQEKVKIVDDVSNIENLKNTYKNFIEIKEITNSLKDSISLNKKKVNIELEGFLKKIKKSELDIANSNVKMIDFREDVSKKINVIENSILKNLKNYEASLSQQKTMLIRMINDLSNSLDENNEQIEKLNYNSQKTRSLVVVLFIVWTLLTLMEFLFNNKLI
jgi:hypothetical protein|tara:strand:+ start:485 stop:1279 length:795 start_codon:yes stop_codon:yes gene_type:complete